MENMKFIHRISKGSRFNQIYVPKEVESEFEVGDIVEVRLMKKKQNLYYSSNLPKLSEFKKKLIKDVFYLLSQFKEIKQIFIFGSFLTQKIEYNDIDILILTEKDDEKFEKNIYNKLTEEFNLKFHVICIEKDKLRELLKINPLIRSMFYYYVSNKKFELPKETSIDEKHIRFLLMMPEDLLEIRLNSKVFYDNLRRLISIEHFLENKDENPNKVNDELKELLGETLLSDMRANNEIDETTIKKLRTIIKVKLKKIKNLLKHG